VAEGRELSAECLFEDTAAAEEANDPVLIYEVRARHAGDAVAAGDVAVGIEESRVGRARVLEHLAGGLTGLLKVERQEDNLAIEGFVGTLELHHFAETGAAPAGVPVEDDSPAAKVRQAADGDAVADIEEREVGSELANIGTIAVEGAEGVVALAATAAGDGQQRQGKDGGEEAAPGEVRRGGQDG
jgi:hypothetical protein